MIKKDPHPNVKLPLINQQRPLDILLNDKAIVFVLGFELVGRSLLLLLLDQVVLAALSYFGHRGAQMLYFVTVFREVPCLSAWSGRVVDYSLYFLDRAAVVAVLIFCISPIRSSCGLPLMLLPRDRAAFWRCVSACGAWKYFLCAL